MGSLLLVVLTELSGPVYYVAIPCMDQCVACGLTTGRLLSYQRQSGFCINPDMCASKRFLRDRYLELCTACLSMRSLSIAKADAIIDGRERGQRENHIHGKSSLTQALTTVPTRYCLQ